MTDLKKLTTPDSGADDKVYGDDWNDAVDEIPYKRGTATITAGNTEVTVTHNKGVANTPRVVPLDDLGGRSFWVPEGDIGVNSFKILISSADFSDHKFLYAC